MSRTNSAGHHSIRKRMKRWQQELQYAAVGMAAAALVEALTPHRQVSRQQQIGRCLLAGGLAALYAHLVPEDTWGLRSGAAFGQLPLVAMIQSNRSTAPPMKLALWGGLMGLGLKAHLSA